MTYEIEDTLNRMIVDDIMDASERLIASHEAARNSAAVKRQFMRNCMDTFDYATKSAWRVGRAHYDIVFGDRRLTILVEVKNGKKGEAQ